MVPNCSLADIEKEKQTTPRSMPVNKDEVKLLELFAGNDIFAHVHED